MKKYHCYSAEFDSDTEKLFKSAEFLGQGNNGIVYKLPGNKVIKIFVEEKVCRDEAYILSKTKKSRIFPKMHCCGRLYVVRDMVNGVRLDKYIKKNGINEEICKNLYYVLKEFERLKFTKIDTRCKDLYVCRGNKIMVIDPKKFYTKNVPFPRHLMKGLSKVNSLQLFLDEIAKIDSNLAIEWNRKFQKYCRKKIKGYNIQ